MSVQENANVNDQAFQLVMQYHSADNEHLRQSAKTKIAAFSVLSDKHLHAIERAEAEWQLFQQAQAEKFSLKERLYLELQRQFASLKDKPTKLVPAAALALLAVMYPALNQHTPEVVPLQIAEQPVQPAIKRYSSQFGQVLKQPLPDGSSITLNWETTVEVKYSAHQRFIKLITGEAHFDVAKDATRPFIVSSSGAQARAVGTAFTVRKLNKNSMQVSVTEGVVEVTESKTHDGAREDKNKVVMLHASQSVKTVKGLPGNTESIPADIIKGWQSGMMVFRNQPLIEVLKEIQRYAPYEIKLGYLAHPDEQVTATYFTTQIEDSLTSLAELFNLEIKVVNSRISPHVLVKSAPPGRPNI